MSPHPVFADAFSRLQADIAFVRLVRAGIPVERMSAVFPRETAPNSASCWLKNFRPLSSAISSTAAAAGVLGNLFRPGVRAAEVERELEELGLSPDITRRLREKTEEGRIVLCVHARNETEVAIAWHIFAHVGFEHISLPDTEPSALPREFPLGIPVFAGIAA